MGRLIWRVKEPVIGQTDIWRVKSQLFMPKICGRLRSQLLEEQTDMVHMTKHHCMSRYLWFLWLRRLMIW